MDHSLKEDVLAQLKGRIAPVKTSPGYNIGLFVVTIAMVLLPLIYIAFIGVGAWSVYMYATDWGQEAIRGTKKGGIFIYLTPIVVGSILVFFMIKPLFARRPKMAGKLNLDPEKEPFLFEYIYSLCDLVGAPHPRKVAVDCQVNASAGFSNGLLSLFRRNDLTLTIGLPLVAGMPLKNLTGVLAHEFGHFSQGFGMKLTLVVRSVNAWFARVVYDRDTWDEWLERASQAIDLRLGVILYLARFFIFLTRKILWLLMVIGHTISCYMLRQMEFDADRYEARVAGGDTFKNTAAKLMILGVASQKTFNELQVSWHEKKLADQLPVMISENVEEIPDELKEEILQDSLTRKTGFYDTHPCDSLRNESAKREGTEGVFHMKSKAQVLFSSFESLSKMASLDMYREEIGNEVQQKHLFPVAQIVEERHRKEEGFKALERFFQGTLHPNIPITVKALENLPQEDMCEEYFQRERESLCAKAPKIRKVIKDDNHWDDKNLSKDLKDHRMDYSQRLNAALACTSYLCEELGPEVNQRKDLLLGALNAIAQHVSPAMKIKEDMNALQYCFQYLEQNGEDENMINQAQDKIKTLHTTLKNISSALPRADYPYDCDGSIAKFLLPKVPISKDDVGELFGCGSDFVERFYTLYYRLLADLTLIAEQVEKYFGFDPLEDVEEKV